MAEAWHIARSARVCGVSGRPIEADRPFFSALVEEGELFRRRDFSAEAWPEVDKTPFFSYWKNKGWSADAGTRARPIDYERLLGFFDDLSGAEEPHRKLFRYVVALILSRRRVLRLDSVRKTLDGDCLVLFDRRKNETLEVFAPDATAGQLKSVQEQLDALFDLEGDDESA